MTKVSILMPAYNVEKYITECMDSVINQTMSDIEIICVNDGSTDDTGRILDFYARTDERVKVIHKPNSGYGNSLNLALEKAQGEYIGIIETDDFAELNMFESLYSLAKQNDADVVKSNYFRYVSKPKPGNTFFDLLGKIQQYEKVFDPWVHTDILRVAPSIWSGIYRRQMLLEHKIKFNETPGASYQDTSFAFKIWTSAHRVYLTSNAYLHYRVDNENSSVKSAAKVFCICDEYQEIEHYLDSFPDKKEKFEILKNALKYESYRWNFERLAYEYRYAFLVKMKQEFEQAETNGKLEENCFPAHQWKDLQEILNKTDIFFKRKCQIYLDPYKDLEDLIRAHNTLIKSSKGLEKAFNDMKNSKSFRLGRMMTAIPRKLRDSIKK